MDMAKRRVNVNGIRIAGGIWRPAKFQSWEPTYYFNLQHQPGIEYQSYGMSSDGKCVHAGVTRHERMNRAVALGIQRVWERWRREYAVRELGNGNPLPCPKVVRLVVFPVDQPERAESFDLEVR